MDVGVAFRTERDEVVFGVIARVTSKLSVVYFQVRHCAAGLASPAIAAQYLLP